MRVALGALYRLFIMFRTSERENLTCLKSLGLAVRRPPMSAQPSHVSTGLLRGHCHHCDQRRPSAPPSRRAPVVQQTPVCNRTSADLQNKWCPEPTAVDTVAGLSSMSSSKAPNNLGVPSDHPPWIFPPPFFQRLHLLLISIGFSSRRQSLILTNDFKWRCVKCPQWQSAGSVGSLYSFPHSGWYRKSSCLFLSLLPFLPTPGL